MRMSRPGAPRAGHPSQNRRACATTAAGRQTVEHSLAHRGQALEYAMSFARGMDPGVADRFVGMWVNEMTVEMGERGRRAVQLFLDRGYQAGIIPRQVAVDFVEA